MLDSDTKRRIDTARDILVGKVPDPKSQVEQITIALIYKFMDDMDAESEELGGKRKFFSGDFARYGWSKLMSQSLGGHELIALYGEGITSMTQNAGIPALFRDIFKNAYLPYRDPETLRSFLKIINDFTYDHSERLGDAFEYLLSVLGSQGDAGQFRTPRHIIDFIVEILAPKKGEVILDPACGTAGFLISSYKYILRNNIDDKKTNTLTPDEKGRLAKNFKGYDISPDMVRLSLVNLYLHGFTNPHIFEYDTLTSEDRWNEFADVILANPPFMSPKGGIKPHKRFSIQAKRSEVLFVDYIAEHLTPTGRAGIIVPESIIFQSQNAYKELRKMLVQNSLVAVISLPAGVFQPYSGVKTSILILDKSLARQSDTVAFFKIENDGFTLGAQRKVCAGEELTRVKVELEEYLRAVRDGALTSNLQLSNGLIVSKEKIAESRDYNFGGDRYQESNLALTRFEFHTIGDIADEIKAGFASGQSSTAIKGVPHIRPMNITESGQFTWDGVKQIEEIEFADKHNYLLKAGDVLFNNTNSKELVGKTCFIEQDIYAGFSNHMTRIRTKSDICLPRFLALILHYSWQKGVFLQLANKWVGQAGINTGTLSEFKIPLPSLAVQKEIVAEIETYQKIIDGARAVVENYRPKISVELSWPIVLIGEVCTINPKKNELISMDKKAIVSFVSMADLNENRMSFQAKNTKELSEVTSSYTYFRNDDVLLAKVSPCFENGKAGIAKNLINGVGFGSSEFYVLRSNGCILPAWIYIAVTTQAFREKAVAHMTGTGGLQRVPRETVESYQISLPPLETQQKIIAEIEVEQALVDANYKLIERFEGKIQSVLSRIWGKNKNIKEPSNEPIEEVSISNEH